MVDAGEISWIKPRSPFSLLAIKSPSWIDGSSQPFYNAALNHEVKEKDRTPTDDLRRINIDLPGVKKDGTDE